MIWKHKFRLKASLWWDLCVRINYHPPVGALCDWVLGGGSVDERRLQSSGGGRRKRREKDQITERCWSWALSSLFRCLHGRRWKRRKSWEKGTDADGGATMEAFCPLLLLLLRGSLYPLHHLFLCTLPPFISPFMSFSYTPPPSFSSCPLLLRLFSSLVSHGALWWNWTCCCVRGDRMELGCLGFQPRRKAKLHLIGLFLNCSQSRRHILSPFLFISAIIWYISVHTQSPRQHLNMLE